MRSLFFAEPIKKIARKRSLQSHCEKTKKNRSIFDTNIKKNRRKNSTRLLRVMALGDSQIWHCAQFDNNRTSWTFSWDAYRRSSCVSKGVDELNLKIILWYISWAPIELGELGDDPRGLWKRHIEKNICTRTYMDTRTQIYHRGIESEGGISGKVERRYVTWQFLGALREHESRKGGWHNIPGKRNEERKKNGGAFGARA